MRRGGLGEREAAIDHRAQLARRDERPDLLANILRQRRLERRLARAQRRSGQRQPAAHDIDDADLGSHAALKGDRDMAPILGKAGEVAWHVIAADHVEHHRNALPLSRFVDFFDEILCVVVDRVACAGRQRRRAFLRTAASDDDLDIERIAQCDRHGADAAGPAMDEHGVTRLCAAALEQVRPDGEQRLGQRRRLDHRQAIGNDQALRDRCEAIFGVTTARDEATDVRTRHRPNDPLAKRDDFTGDFEPRNRRCSGGRWIHSATLKHIGAIDPGGGDADQHLAHARRRHRQRFGHQDVRIARFADCDNGHSGGYAGHRDTSSGDGQRY